jgi:sulfur relay protein TusB/DsrH
MLVIVKSAPDTTEGKRGFQLASDMAADIVLIQNGVYFAQKDSLKAFKGNAYVLDEDSVLRGLQDEEMAKDLKRINYDSLVDLMADDENVVGMF